MAAKKRREEKYGKTADDDGAEAIKTDAKTDSEQGWAGDSEGKPSGVAKKEVDEQVGVSNEVEMSVEGLQEMSAVGRDVLARDGSMDTVDS